MKSKLILAGLIILTGLSACQKDLSGAWVGTYTGTYTGTAVAGKVVITEVNKTTIKMDLQSGAGVTFATIANGKVSDNNTVLIDEDGTIATSPGKTYHFSGSGSLSGNNLTLSGQAVNTTASSDVQLYPFTGTK